MRLGLALVSLLGLIAGSARAEVAAGDRAPRGWFAGFNLRTDYGTHLVRAGGGYRRGRLAATLVLDPKVFFDPRQNDTDGFVEWMLTPGGWALLAGGRLTQLSIDRGKQYHHMLLVGATGGLPALRRSLRARFGAELEVTLLRHGAGIELDVLSLRGGRNYGDLLSVNLFLRLEYAAAL